MHHVIFGAGAVGGVVGARVAPSDAAGASVTLVARGEHLAAIRRDGLVLDAPEGRHVVGPDRAASAASAAEVDWSVPDTVVLLAVKSQQTAAAVADLGDHAPPGTPIVCLQNGVANEAVVLRRFEHVHAVPVKLPATHLEQGVVVQTSAGTPGILDVGRFPSGVDATDEALAVDLRAAGFACEPRHDIMAWKHRKLLSNLGNGVDAAFVPGADADELRRRCEAEGETVLAAAGVPLVPADADRVRRSDLLRRRTDLDPANSGASTWQSLARGPGAPSGTEVDHLSGEIVLLGRLHGLPTPANAAVQAAVHSLARRRAPARSLSAADVLTGLSR